LTVFFSLLGSAPSKAAHRMLIKLTPDEGVDLLIDDVQRENT